MSRVYNYYRVVTIYLVKCPLVSEGGLVKGLRLVIFIR